jgi:thiamine pyrophosphokinase
MNNILIFANGDKPPMGWEWVRNHVTSESTMIAADGGTRHLFDLDLFPDVIIGDMDSLDPFHKKRLEDEDIAFVSSPQEKNETDLELALLFAAQNYEGSIRVFGSSGGRLDQTLSNVLLLAHPGLRGRDVRIVEQNQMAWLVDHQTSIHGRVGDLVSLLPQWGEVTVERTTGLRWKLKQEALSPGPARGVSNVMTEDQAEIYIAAGRLLCVHTYQSWNR